MSENKDQNQGAKKPEPSPTKSAQPAKKELPATPVKKPVKPASKVKEKTATSGKPTTPKKPSPAGKPPATGRGLAWLALLLVVAAVFLGLWRDSQTQDANAQALLQSDAENQRLQAEIESLQQAVETLGGEVAGKDIIQPKLDQLGSRIDALNNAQAKQVDGGQAMQSRLTSLEQAFTGVADRQQVAENTLSGLSLNQQATDRDVILAEVAFLVRSAAQRLELFNDQSAAVVFLQLADQQLGSVKGRQFAPVRQRIEQELLALSLIQSPNITALSGKLLLLEKSVDNWQARLPNRDTAATKDLKDGESGWLEKLSYLASSLVSIREDQASYDFLTLAQADRLKDRIRLELQVARIAALAFREDQYQASLSRVNNWIVEHFDSADAKNAAALDQLRQLQQINLSPDWPSLNPLLVLLQQLEGLATSPAVELNSSEAQP